MITINGRKFAKNDSQFNDTLFQSGGTAFGFYKLKKNGILFLNLQKKPFLFLCNNKPSNPFFVSCTEIMNKGKRAIRYMFSTCSIDEKLIGIENFSFMRKHELCLSLIQTHMKNQ